LAEYRNQGVEMNLTPVVVRLSLSAMSVRLLKLPLVLALMVSIGLHWALLQSVAWVGMVVSYSQDASFSAAITKTFDGQHPCKLCHFVKEGQQQEKKQDVQKPGPKFDACLDAAAEIAFSNAQDALVPALADSPVIRPGSPVPPPPRLV
jgi:hypothetical protein